MAKGMTGSRCQPARAPVGGERTASWLPARAPVGGERTAASQTSFTESESDVRHSEGVRGGPLNDFWFRIRLWKAVAEGITGSRCQPARGPVGGERTAYWVPARAPVGGQRTAASQTSFTASESDVRQSEGVRGGPLQGDFWSRIRLWKAVAEGITGSRCQPARGPVGGERTAYWLPARAPVGGERTAASQTSFTESESDVRHSEGVRGGPLQGDFWSRIRLWKAVAEGIPGSRCQPARGPVGGERTAYWPPARALHRLVLRLPKATLDSFRAHGEDPFRARIRLWKAVAERSRCQPARGPVGGERTAYWLPARASVGDERTAASQTSFTASESDVRQSEGARGRRLEGDLLSRIRLWKAVAKGWEQVSTSQSTRGR